MSTATATGFKPRILVFSTNNISDPGIDLAGSRHMHYPAQVSTMNVPCSSGLLPGWSLHAVAPLLEGVQDPSGLEPAAAGDVHRRDLGRVVHVPAPGQVDAGIGDVVRREDEDPWLEPGRGSSGHGQLTSSCAGKAAGSRRRRPNRGSRGPSSCTRRAGP